MIDADRILLINCSAPNYNLAIDKMKLYFGDRAYEAREINMFTDFDAVMLSVIFSWDVPFAIEQAKKALWMGKKVMIGGGGTFRLSNYIFKETGIRPIYKPVPELESVDGKFKMVYYTRGCNETCSHCSVWIIEGRKFTMNYKSHPAKVLMDNNLSAIPWEYKEHIVEQYLRSGITSVDCNSGFEPKSVDEKTVRLFDKLPMRWWRIGFDEIEEEKQVIEAVKVIQSISKKKIRMYTMIGKEPIEQSRYRCEKTIEMGCEPVPQAYIQHDALEKKPTILHDWTLQKLTDMQRFFYSPQLWRKLKLEEYVPRVDGNKPFAVHQLAP